MQKLIYSIDFTSYWHTGSGLSSGVGAKALVIKDDHDLPFIPGRTLKGMIRDAAENLHELDPTRIPASFIATVFGRSDDDRGNGPGKSAAAYQDNGCFFGNASLSQFLHQNIASREKAFLYANIASTAIDDEGQALDHTLRQMEVTIPLTLYAYIDHFPDDKLALERLESCLKWIKRIGYNRNRGLGRCQFSLINQGS